jgi:hypothetical protein
MKPSSTASIRSEARPVLFAIRSQSSVLSKSVVQFPDLQLCAFIFGSTSAALIYSCN